MARGMENGDERRGPLPPHMAIPFHLPSSGIAASAAMMIDGGEHEAPRVHLYSRPYRFGILVPPRHRYRRCGRDDIDADQSQPRWLAVRPSQGLLKAGQIAQTQQAAEAGRVTKTCRCYQACRPAEAPRRKARCARSGSLEPCRLEAGRNPLRSRKIPDRAGCRTYRRIGRRDQRPQRLRVCL